MKYLTSDIVNLQKPLYTKSNSNRGHYTLVLKEKNAPSTPTNESSRIPSATYFRGLTSGDKQEKGMFRGENERIPQTSTGRQNGRKSDPREVYKEKTRRPN